MENKISIGRKDIILMVLNNFKKVYGKTYLQKLLFIIKNELKLKEFDYDAYFYGPYSKDLNDDVSELIEEGLINEEIQVLKNDNECYIYSLTNQGKDYFEQKISTSVDTAIKDQIDKICSRFSNFTPTQLLKYVYQIYPKSAENSVFFDN